MTLFGGVIYGLVAILPLFYQTVMGYSARSAGLAVSPRGIGAICIMPVVAVLTSKVDNRWLISTGFLALRRHRYLDEPSVAGNVAMVAADSNHPQRRRPRDWYSSLWRPPPWGPCAMK